MSDDVTSLTSQLQNLSTGVVWYENKANSPPIIETECLPIQSAIRRVRDYQEAAAASVLKVNPKLVEEQEKLPIYKKRKQLLEAIQRNQILIIIGETGSGKTTQIPQFLKDAGVALAGRIGCTQLRRMAAKRVAKRVAQEQGCKLGEEVGYIIRFDDKTSPKTKIQYMTDGILLRECTRDRRLSTYSAIMLDESHERSVETDVLLAVLKWVTKKRKDLKLIISSATLDAKRFSSYFDNAEVFEITGRMFHVEVIYEQRKQYREYTHRAGDLVKMINETKKNGDILIFMTGERDIEDLAEKLNEYSPSSLYPSLEVCPCYSSLPWEQQEKIFEPTKSGTRKVIIATNIAETSLTLNGIKYVIDSGWVKQVVYDPKSQLQILKPVRISQAQAIQRTGRAGRVGTGKCYHLYTKSDFDSFAKNPDPEILRSNLTNAVLLLKSMGFTSIHEFDFIDSPPKDLIDEALLQLLLLGAVYGRDDPITELGKNMAAFPLDPCFAKMLIESEKFGCSEEIVTIVALMSVGNIFYRPRNQQKLADAAKLNFFTNYGDLFVNMNVYNEWLRYDMDENWCYVNFIQGKTLHEARYVREHLLDIMKARSMKLKSCGPYYKPILKSICAGFISNLARRTDTGVKISYTTLPANKIVKIHPGSSMVRVAPQWVLYHKVVLTTKEYMRDVTPINVQWILEACPSFLEQTLHDNERLSE